MENLKYFSNLSNSLNTYNEYIKEYINQNPPKRKRYKIECRKCNTILKYYDNEEIGWEDAKEMIREYYSGIEIGHKLIPKLVMPTKLYIYCPCCGEKVYTREIWARHPAILFGEMIGDKNEETN